MKYVHKAIHQWPPMGVRWTQGDHQGNATNGHLMEMQKATTMWRQRLFNKKKYLVILIRPLICFRNPSLFETMQMKGLYTVYEKYPYDGNTLKWCNWIAHLKHKKGRIISIISMLIFIVTIFYVKFTDCCEHNLQMFDEAFVEYWMN